MTLMLQTFYLVAMLKLIPAQLMRIVYTYINRCLDRDKYYFIGSYNSEDETEYNYQMNYLQIKETEFFLRLNRLRYLMNEKEMKPPMKKKNFGGSQPGKTAWLGRQSWSRNGLIFWDFMKKVLSPEFQKMSTLDEYSQR